MSGGTARPDLRAAAATGAVALAVVGAGCDAGDRGGAFDDEVAADLDARVEAGADQATAGGVVTRVEAPDGQRTMAVGPADLDGDETLSGDEAFRVASITKMFTATAALQLAEEDAVDLDAPVADVVPERAELFEHGGEITLRQLLGHTAGLPGDPNEQYFDDAWELGEVDDGVVTFACGDVERHDPWDYVDGGAVFEPGTDWAYSNVGFFLAGEVIEAVADQPLADVYRTRILDPLGMDDTWLDCGEQPRGELAAGIHPPGVDDLPGQDDEPFDVTGGARDAGAAGGLASTAEDLAVFARALFDGELFDEAATLEAMLEPGPSPYYGLGVMLGTGRDDAVGHDGRLPGYNSRLSYDAERDAVVVALNNGTSASHRTPVTTHIADRVMVVLPRDDQTD